jgi:hypothetical protein
MNLLYHEDELEIWICYYYSYFEIFGLSDESFSELTGFYRSLEYNSFND